MLLLLLACGVVGTLCVVVFAMSCDPPPTHDDAVALDSKDLDSKDLDLNNLAQVKTVSKDAQKQGQEQAIKSVRKPVRKPERKPEREFAPVFLSFSPPPWPDLQQEQAFGPGKKKEQRKQKKVEQCKKEEEQRKKEEEEEQRKKEEEEEEEQRNQEHYHSAHSKTQHPPFVRPERVLGSLSRLEMERRNSWEDDAFVFAALDVHERLGEILQRRRMNLNTTHPCVVPDDVVHQGVVPDYVVSDDVVQQRVVHQADHADQVKQADQADLLDHVNQVKQADQEKVHFHCNAAPMRRRAVKRQRIV